MNPIQAKPVELVQCPSLFSLHGHGEGCQGKQKSTAVIGLDGEERPRRIRHTPATLYEQEGMCGDTALRLLGFFVTEEYPSPF